MTSEKEPKKWIPVAVVAGVAIAAGIFVSSQVRLSEGGGGRYNEQEAAQADQAQEQFDSKMLESVQVKLQNSTVLPDDFKQVPPFSLLQSDSAPLTEAILKDKWSVLFFGFINCPDVCPVTLNEMKGVVAQLASENETVPQVLFITIDPVRDTIDKMTEYVAYFDESFIPGSGELSDITALTSKLGIVASYTANTDGSDNYSVDHTSSMLLIDPTMRVRAKLNAPHKIDTLVSDLKTIMSHYN